MKLSRPGQVLLPLTLVIALAGIGVAKNKNKDDDYRGRRDPHHPTGPRSPGSPHGGSSHPGGHRNDCDRLNRELAEARSRIAQLEAELRACRHR